MFSKVSGMPGFYFSLKWLFCLATAAPIVCAALPVESETFSDKLIVLGSGPKGGAFQPVAESLCEAVNLEREKSLVRCVTMPTAGSVFNLYGVRNGVIQAGIAQEDLYLNMIKATEIEKDRGLRTLAVLHDSPIVVVVRKGLGIRSLTDLRGKAFNVGNQGSGQATIASALLGAAGLSNKDLAAAATLPTPEIVKAFCEKQIDGMVEAVAHPSSLYKDLLNCGGEFLDLGSALMDKLRHDNPHLKPMSIPSNTYSSQTTEFYSIGMRNILFTREDVSDIAVERFLKAFNKNFGLLRQSDPILKTIPVNTIDILKSVTTSPHTGAERAFSAKGQP